MCKDENERQFQIFRESCPCQRYSATQEMVCGVVMDLRCNDLCANVCPLYYSHITALNLAMEKLNAHRSHSVLYR